MYCVHMYITLCHIEVWGDGYINICCVYICGAGGSEVCWLTALQAGKSRVRLFAGELLGFFSYQILPTALCALGSTHPLIQISTVNISWVKDSRCVWLTNLSHSCANFLESWESQCPGTPSACPGLNRGCLIYTFIFSYWRNNDSW